MTAEQATNYIAYLKEASDLLKGDKKQDKQQAQPPKEEKSKSKAIETPTKKNDKPSAKKKIEPKKDKPTGA